MGWSDNTSKENMTLDIDAMLKQESGAALAAPAAPAPVSEINVATPIPDSPFAGLINKAAQTYGVDPKLVTEVIRQESAFNPKATSDVGAQGLMQLMPKTAEYLGVTDPYDPEQNVMAGTKYLAENLKRFGGDVNKALAAYNAGPTRIAREGMDNLPAETQEYITKIGSKYQPSPKRTLPGPVDNVRLMKLAKSTDAPAEEVQAAAGWWERLKSEPKAFARSYSIASKNVERSFLGYKAMEGKATPEELDTIVKLGGQIEAEGKLAAQDPIEARAVGQLFPSIVQSGIAGGAGAMKGAIVGGVGGSLAPGIGTLAGVALMAPVGAANEVVQNAYKMESGGAYVQAIDKGIDHEIAAPMARMYGGVSSLLELVSFKRLKHIIPGGDKLGGEIMKTAINSALGKVVAPVGKAAVRLAGASTGEATIEATQQLAQNLSEEIAKAVNDRLKGTDLKAKDKEEFANNLFQGVAETFAITFLGMGITSLPGTSINLLLDTKAGREAAAAAKEEAPDVPVEETIKKKAAKKQAAKAKKSAMQKAADENEAQRLAAKEKEAKKATPKQPITPLTATPVEKPAPLTPAAAAGEGVGPEGPDTTPSYPDRTVAPVKPAVETPVAPQGPIKDLFATTPTENPDIVQGNTGLHDFVSKYANNDPNNPYIDMMMKEDTKGLFQNKLTQPAILLADGTIVAGTELSSPWQVSDFQKDSTKSQKTAEEITDSYSEARKRAFKNDKDYKNAKTGFLVDGKFFPSQVIVDKFKIGQHIEEQRAAIETGNDEALKTELAAFDKARESWAETVKNSREMTKADETALEKLLPAAKKAAKKAVNTNLGKHIDISDMQSAAREAMVMIVLGTDPAKINLYNTGKSRTFFNFMVGAVGNALKNYKKEELGQRAGGMSRRAVETALANKTMRLPLQPNEAVLGETVTPGDNPLFAQTKEEGVESPTAPKTAVYSNAMGARAADVQPGVVKRIDPTTNKVIEEVAPAEQRMRLAERRAQIRKTNAERNASIKAEEEAAIAAEKPVKGVSKESQNSISRMADEELKRINETLSAEGADTTIGTKYFSPEAMLAGEGYHGMVASIVTYDHAKEVQAQQIAKGNRDAMIYRVNDGKYVVGYGKGRVKAPAKVTPTQKLGKNKQAKPARKVKKPSSVAQEAKANNNPIDTQVFENLKKQGGVVQKKDGTHSFSGIKGAVLLAGKLNKTEGEGRYEAVPHPSSPGNYAVVNMDMWANELINGGVVATPARVDADPSPVTKNIHFNGGEVPTQGTIFDQITKQNAKVEAAANEEITDLFGNKLAIPKEEEASIVDELGDDSVSKATMKGLKDLFGNEQGSASILNHLVEKLYKSAQVTYRKFSELYDKFDVEAKWKRIGASEVGLRIKNMFGKIHSVELREGKKLMQLSKLIRSIDKNMSNDDLVSALLAAEDPGIMAQIDEKLKPIAEWIRNYFDASLQEYADRNIDIDFKRRKMADLMDTYMNTTDYDTFMKAMEHMGRLEQVEFVHIPLSVLKQSIQERIAKEEKITIDEDEAAVGKKNKTKEQKKADDQAFRRRFNAKMKALENLAAKRRQALSIADMLKHGIMKADDLNVFTLLGNYMRNKANDFAVADIRDAALKNDLLKVQKSKPKKNEFGEWRSLPPKIKGLGFYKDPTGKEGKMWIHDSVVNQIMDSLEVAHNRGKLQRFVALTKMTQFIQFWFLPMYDLWQHAMAGGWSTIGRPDRIVSALYKTFTNHEDFLEAQAEGMSSKPFADTFKNYMDHMKLISNKTKYGWTAAMLMDIASQALNLKTGSVPGMIYRASYFLAWKMDEGIRMMTYEFLREKGHSPSDAAQIAAKFHGDYAGVPMKTRQMLNFGLFTPTFKIAMMKTFGEMAGSVADLVAKGLKLKKGEITDRQRRMAIGAASTAAILLGQSFVMSRLGFEEDELERKYTKEILDAWGNPKELVVTTSSPANVPFRLWARIASPFAPESSNAFASWAKSFSNELHPMWRMAIELIANRRADGNPIFGSLDSFKTKTLRTLDYMAEGTFSLYKELKKGSGILTPEQKETREHYKNAFGKWWMLFDKLTFGYIRNSKDYRHAMQIRQLRSQARSEMRREMKRGNEIPTDWLENFQTKVRQILED